MGKRELSTVPKDDESPEIGPDSDSEESSEPEKSPVEPLFKKAKKNEAKKKEESSDDDDEDGDEKGEKSEEEEKEAEPFKVYVGQIPWSEKDKKDVFKLFEGCGEIVKHELPSNIFGFLTFKSEEAVAKALKQDGAEFRGGKLKVNAAGGPKTASSYKKNKARKLRAKERKQKKVAEKKAAADLPVKDGDDAEGKKKTRRSKGKKDEAKDGKKKGLSHTEYKKAKDQEREGDTRTREERRADYGKAAKIGALGRGGRGGSRGGGKPFAGRGGSKSGGGESD